MKVKRNKKHYSFTANQKRNDSHRFIQSHYTIGKELKTWANRKFRRDNKIVLRKTIGLQKELPYIRHRKFLDWYAF